MKQIICLNLFKSLKNKLDKILLFLVLIGKFKAISLVI